MKRKILICVACITVTGAVANAQKKAERSTTVTSENVRLNPPPPAPPEPPAPPIAPVDPELVAIAPPPPPPIPPLPPVPPVPSEEELLPPCADEYVSEIVNENGYEVSIQNIKERKVIVLKKDGKTQKIRLTTWNSDPKFYEKKFGKLRKQSPEIEI